MGQQLLPPIGTVQEIHKTTSNIFMPSSKKKKLVRKLLPFTENKQLEFVKLHHEDAVSQIQNVGNSTDLNVSFFF